MPGWLSKPRAVAGVIRGRSERSLAGPESVWHNGIRGHGAHGGWPRGLVAHPGSGSEVGQAPIGPPRGARVGGPGVPAPAIRAPSWRMIRGGLVRAYPVS